MSRGALCERAAANRRKWLIPAIGISYSAHVACTLSRGVRQLSRTLVRLNLETRRYHHAADAAWTGLVAPSFRLTIDRYRELLVRVYGFDAPLESALAYTPHLDVIANSHRRFRSGLIAQDLLSLGMNPGELARVPQAMIAPFASVAEALGWMYAHERMTLVHDTVRSELCTRVPGLVRATAYLGAYEGSVGAHWDDFGNMLDRVATTPAIEQRIIDAAHDAHRMLTEWLQPAEQVHAQHA